MALCYLHLSVVYGRVPVFNCWRINLKPCDTCKNINYCQIKKFVEKHKHLGAFALDNKLRQKTAVASLVKCTKNEIVLECADYNSNKPINDYSMLLHHKTTVPNEKECKSCQNSTKCSKKKL